MKTKETPRDTFAVAFVREYGRFILGDQGCPWNKWTPRMIYTESYHQMMASLLLYSNTIFKGWCALPEVAWGRRDRTDLVFVHIGHSLEMSLKQSTFKLELKVICAGDWSDRWAFACPDLVSSTPRGKPRCDFLLAVVIDDLKERKKKLKAKKQFEGLIALPVGEKLQPETHCPRTKRTKGLEHVRLLARWPESGYKEVHNPGPAETDKRKNPEQKVIICALASA